MDHTYQEAGNVHRRLRRDAAAAYITDKHGIPCSPRTLAKYAVIGGGPAFRKAGRFPLYDLSDLDQWAESKIGPRVNSTSELWQVQDAA
jgi:hypothetical protein